MPNHAEQLAQELNLNVKNVQGAIELIDQGNTIPFIARYRKEATGSMDDQVLRDLGDRLEYLRGLDKRKDEVTSSITEQGAMTPELTAALSKAKTLAEVEDIYRPYKPKRKTRASIAKARGLQPLATAIFRQDAAFDPERAAADYLNDEVPDAAAALAEEFGFTVVRNDRPEDGLSRTVRLGTEAMVGCDAILYQVADQPLLEQETVRRELEYFRTHPDHIVGLAHNGVRGNPCIFPRKFFPELMALEGDVGGNVVIRAHPDALLLYETSAAELRDVDTVEALAAIQEDRQI